MSLSIAAQLQAFEAISRHRPDRVLRLIGSLPDGSGGWEPCELLIFRGFSSSVSHPTGFDPDQPLLPPDARLESAELLAGPLNPAAEQRLAGPLPAATFLAATAWH
jgi:hypothetical protein